MMILTTDKNAGYATNSKYDATLWATGPYVGITQLFMLVRANFTVHFRDRRKIPGSGFGGIVTRFVKMVTIFGRDLNRMKGQRSGVRCPISEVGERRSENWG